MDPIKTIGKLLDGTEQRDAIHIAIMPVKAGELLGPGKRITIKNGIAYHASDSVGLGIVDPFLEFSAEIGQRFWMFLHPNTVQSIRHEWTHSEIDKEVSRGSYPDMKAAEQWLRDFAAQWDMDYLTMIGEAQNNGGGYICSRNTLHGAEELGDDHAEFWKQLEILTGKRFSVEHINETTWTCSC